MMFSFGLMLAWCIAVCLATACPPLCPPLSGDIHLNNQFQLYPVYFVWDPKRCIIYASSIFNATVVAWDPYKSELLEVISFPGISHPGLVASDKRLSGIALDATSSVLTALIQADEFFLSAGNDVSGDNFVVRYDLNTKKILSQVNLTATTQGQYGAFIDLEPGIKEDFFVNGAYPSSILHISANKHVSPLFVSEPTTPPRTYGFGGLARYGKFLITNDNAHQQLVKFDIEDCNHATPVVIPQTPYHNFTGGTAMRLPKKYGGTVLLQSEDDNALNTTGVSVWKSVDGWKTAKYKGFISGRKGLSGYAPAISQVDAREIAGRIYSSLLFYDNTVNPSMAGNRSDFTFKDITDDVDELLREDYWEDYWEGLRAWFN